MSIFEETLRPFVRKQLRIREAILKQGNKGESRLGSNTVDLSSEEGSKTAKLPAGAFYTYTTSRQCTIRMCSGVDLLPDTDVPEGGSFESESSLVGEKMAIRYILEGGIPAKNIDFGGIKTAQKDGYIQGPRNGFPGTNKRNFNQVGYGFHYGDPYIRSDAKEDMGIVPMPGIIDAQIRTQTPYGSLRTAKVNFKCHNRRQLEILELLYMRPGYPILLEWGWSTYISDDGAGTIKRQQEFPFIPEFFEGNSTQEFINSIILENKIKTGGNYDGFLGFCKNFEFVSRPDGGFDCSTEIIAAGEALEGLKGKNSGLKIKKEDKDYPVTNLEYYLYSIKEFTEAAAYRQGYRGDDKLGLNGARIEITEPTVNDVFPLNVGLYNAFNQIAGLANDGTGSLYKLTPSDVKTITSASIKQESKSGGSIKDGTAIKKTSYKNVSDPTLSEYQDALNEIETIVDAFFLYKSENLSVEGDKGDDDTKAAFNYIRWDFLVEILNKFIIDKVKDTDTKSESITELTYLENPLGKQNPKYSTYNTFKLTTNNQAKKIPDANGNIVNINLEELMDMSVDPTVSILPHQIVDLTKMGKDDYVFKGGNAPTRSIGKIFLNIDDLFDLYTKLKGENFNLFNYIDTIWKDVNTACGNTHNFELLTELERPNVVKIADMTFQAEALPPESLFEFKIQSNESIVRDFNFNSTIPNEIAATTAITAQARSIESIDNVSFAALNKNIKSRFSITNNDKIPVYQQQQERIKLAKRYDSLVQELVDTLVDLHEYRKQMLRGDFIEVDSQTGTKQNTLATDQAKFNVKNTEKKVNSLLLRYSEDQKDGDIITNYKGSLKDIPPKSKSAIIPLNFNCQIDGIGGIVIGNVIKVDKTRLPKGYQSDEVGFVIFSESQTITAGQDWTTEFQGKLILLDLESKENETEIFKELQLEGNLDVPETMEIDERSANQVDEEQTNMDPSLSYINEGDELFLKINNSFCAIRSTREINNEGYWIDNSDNCIGVFKKDKKGLKLGTIVPNGIKVVDDTIVKTEKVNYKESTNEDGSITYQELDENGKVIKTFTAQPGSRIIKRYREVVKDRRLVWYLINFTDEALSEENFYNGASLEVPLEKNGSYKLDLNGADDDFTDVIYPREEYGISEESRLGWMRWDTVMDDVDDEIPTDDPEIEVITKPIVELVEYVKYDDREGNYLGLGTIGPLVAEYVIEAKSNPNLEISASFFEVMLYEHYKEDYQLDKDGNQLTEYKANVNSVELNSIAVIKEFGTYSQGYPINEIIEDIREKYEIASDDLTI